MSSSLVSFSLPVLVYSRTMDPPTLGELPDPALDLVCEYLAYSDLSALAHTNRVLYFATESKRFSTIRIYTRDGKLIHDNVTRTGEVLGLRRIKHKVRMLEFVDQQWGRNRQAKDAGDMDSPAGSLGGARIFGAQEMTRPPNSHRDDPSADPWVPVVKLLSQMEALNDVVWACTYAMSGAVLDAIHEHHPKCRLHVHAFSLPDMYEWHEQEEPTFGNPGHDEETREMQLRVAKSPCLHSVLGPRIQEVHYHSFWGELRLLRILSLSNIGVRHLYEHEGDRVPGQREWEMIPCASENSVRPWDDFRTHHRTSASEDSQGRTNKVPLQSLQTGCLLNAADLHKWTHVIDTSALTTLDLWHGRISRLDSAKDELPSALASLAEAGSLKALRVLAINLAAIPADPSEWEEWINGDQQWIPEDWPSGDAAMGRLLRALSPLRTLRVRGAREKTLAGIIGHHGTGLDTLVLTSTHVSLPVLQQLSRNCARVRVLRVGLMRTEGDEIEVLAYEALGAMPRLETLTLDLHVLGPELTLSTLEISRALCNAAVDEALARAIFNVVKGANDRTEGRLARITVRPVCPRSMILHGTEGHQYDQRAWLLAIRSLGKWWKLERVSCRAHVDAVQVEERTRHDDVESWVDLNSLVRKPDPDPWPVSWQRVWQELWPLPSRSNVPWIEHSRSKPLWTRWHNPHAGFGRGSRT